MKKTFALLALLLSVASASAQFTNNALRILQYNAAAGGFFARDVMPTATPGVFMLDTATMLPVLTPLGSNLIYSGGVLDATGGGAPTSSQIISALGFAPYDASNPAGYVTGSSLTATLSAYQTTAAATTALAGKFNSPTGSIAQYIRGDGSLASFPSVGSGTVTSVGVTSSTLTVSGSPVTTSGSISVNLPNAGTAGTYNNVTTDSQGRVTSGTNTLFNYGAINARTFAASTAYQATDPAKAAVVKVSPSCTASLSLTAGGTCTIQARVGASGLSCSTGSVIATWTNANTGTLTVGLGLNQTVGSPGNIELAIGEYFILCPTAGTFTIANGIDRSQG